MALTKPAGCVIALVGGVIAWIGIQMAYITGHPDLNRGASAGSTVPGLLVAALGVLVALSGSAPWRKAARTKQGQAAEAERTTRKCPACAEMVLADARKCRFCGEALT